MEIFLNYIAKDELSYVCIHIFLTEEFILIVDLWNLLKFNMLSTKVFVDNIGDKLAPTILSMPVF